MERLMRYPPTAIPCPRWILGVALVSLGLLGCDDTSEGASPAGGGGVMAGGADLGLEGGAGGLGGAPAGGAVGGAVGGAGGEPAGGAGGEPMGGHGGVGGGEPPGPECEAPGQPLRRLTRAQYLHTVTDLLTALVGETAEGEHFWWVMEGWPEQIPEDVPVGAPGEIRGGFRRLDQVVYEEHVEVTLRLATTLAGELSQPWWAERVLGPDCDLHDDDIDCVTPMVMRVGRLVHRRPLTDEQVQIYVDVYRAARDEAGAPADPEDEWWWRYRVGLRTLFATLLSAPQLLYQVEHGVPGEGGVIDEARGLYRLDAYELASRLSYHFWQSMPDEALLDAAEDGSLLTDAGFEAQVARLYADARARRALGSFFTEWLRLDELPDLTRLRYTPVFDAFAEGVEVHEGLRQAMVDEIVEMGMYHAVTAPTDLDGMFTSALNFARDEALASIYGAGVWGGGEPEALPEVERAGLLTRAAMVASGSANTRPIMKGIKIREAVLCGEVPPPPPEVMVQEPELSGEMTSREVVEALTEQPGSVCVGCHATYINPLGFATENLDALGRVRAEQILYDEWGEEIGRRPIDTEAAPAITPGDEAVAAGAHELTALILESGRAHDCFAQQYFRFTFGRPEHRADQPLIEELSARLRAGAPLDEVLLAVARSPEFRQLRLCVDGEE